MTISSLALGAKRVIDAAWLNGDAYDLSSQAAFALESTQMLQSPETAAEFEALRARVAELEQAQGSDRERVELLAGFERALEPFCAEPGVAAAAVAAVRDPDREWLLRDAQRLQDRVIELEAEVRLLNTQRGDVAQLVERERGYGEECVDIDDVVAALSLGADESAEAGPEERLLGEDKLKGAVRGHLFGGGR